MKNTNTTHEGNNSKVIHEESTRRIEIPQWLEVGSSKQSSIITAVL